MNSVSKENLPSLGDILEYTNDNKISIILFLEIRDVDTARSAWTFATVPMPLPAEATVETG
ncbi:hypothetical protein QA640_39305 [Bradyrhizobium sp. CB82]|uniref:hypothetical protein n=1 Tax=Bradyrhizobium sp. CB82 TaxID=3039159 RepID=UPI0024B17CB7|nr:hypothetical protein [Bradyrhizobium sp. CB82]WFU40189.1 hypothetical protein QA640_39305 [Bradyrhizobium sp. CB82]